MKQILILLLIPFTLLAHPGGTDKNGGHYNRKTGEYHYHGPPKAASPKVHQSVESKRTPIASKYTEAEIDRRIGAYFQAGNLGVIDTPPGVIHERDVSESLKERVKQRDGYKCLTCGSNEKLEVDHIIALMNGGNNSIGNLATLCDSCHTKKTRMDNSLRRKREQIFGKQK